MPPCRSSPRLIELRHGYRYHTETAMTARTKPIRSRRCLGILLALLLLFLLRAQQEEIEDREHRRDHDDRGQHALRAAAWRRAGRIREIREEHRLGCLRRRLCGQPRKTSTDDT